MRRSRRRWRSWVRGTEWDRQERYRAADSRETVVNEWLQANFEWSWKAQRVPSIIRLARESSNTHRRAIAIEAIGYGLHSTGQIEALTHSALDPDRSVRNDAIRAPWVLASSQVELQATIPHDTLVDFLNSDVRTDRNKSIALLAALTEDRDSGVLTAILERSFAPLDRVRPMVLERAYIPGSGHPWPNRRIGEVAVSTRAWDAGVVGKVLAEIQRSNARYAGAGLVEQPVTVYRYGERSRCMPLWAVSRDSETIDSRCIGSNRAGPLAAVPHRSMFSRGNWSLSSRLLPCLSCPHHRSRGH